ncbi:MAG TPA: GTPase Era [Acidiferrobacterales bacterium]|jgi:GTP-binding protein Era
MTGVFRCGFVALIGRPNAGKSTLLNRLVGQKVSITSRRPQTTRHRILGIHNESGAQIVYVDTPGLHAGEGNTMNRYMNRAATGSVEGVDVVVLMITARGWTAADEPALGVARRQRCPVILAINKIDRLENRTALLPLIEGSRARLAFAEIVPLSAQTGEGVDELARCLRRYLPEQPAHFPDDQISDRSDRFMAGELVREQIFRGYGQEVPYAAAVEIAQFKEEPKLIRIEAVIWVEKTGQKAILIGKGGSRLKEVGRRARLAMQKQFGRKVHLELWVKVRAGWADDVRTLRSLGYSDES